MANEINMSSAAQLTLPGENALSAVPQAVALPSVALVEQQKPEPPPDEQVEAIVSDLNDFVQKVSRELQFSVNKDFNQTVVKVIDKENEVTIRQIPSQEMLDLRKKLDEMRGILFDRKA